MPDDSLPPSLQESLLALLAFNDQHGTAVAAQVRPEHFDAPYQEIATKLLGYRREQGRAPGHAHLDDLFGWALERGDRAPRLRKLLVGINDLSRGLNGEYVAKRVQDFIRKQTLKSAIMRASELYQSGGDDHVAQVEQVLYSALRTRQQGLSPGTRLSDIAKSLRFLEYKAVDFPLGIPALDNINLGACLKQLFLYIGAKGTGKTWFCVHMGKQGLLHRAKVLHITNEFAEDLIAGRYYQSLFSVASQDKKYARTSFEYDELKRLLDVSTKQVKPKVSFAQSDIRKVLRDKITQWGLRLGSIIIKEFPSGTLTIQKLETYLDYLESMEKFVPTMVIVDYPDLMKQDSGNLRISIGQTFVNLRGLASERNFALIAPTQGGRGSMGAKKVRSNMVSEDISKVMTADNVMTYSQTEAEKRLGLARLYVDHARNTQGGYEVVISQAYAIGQFVLESALKSTAYEERLKGDDYGDEDED